MRLHQNVENEEVNTRNLWSASRFTQTPNEVIRWVCREAKSVAEIRMVLLIARLSCGFKKRSTIGRYCLGDFAGELGCHVSTVQRAVKRLQKVERIFRFDPQGDHFYYSLYDPDAMRDRTGATPHGAIARRTTVAAKRDKSLFAPTQHARGGTEHISSVVQRVTPTH